MGLDPQVNSLSETTPTVFECGGQVRTSSRDVAELFEKRHADVLRSIDDVIAAAPATERNFALSTYQDASGRSHRSFNLDRDGFALLAMGFTGTKALQFKMAYIEAFNRMEAELRSRPAIPDFSNPDFLLKLVVDYANDKKALLGQVEAMESTVAAFDQIADASGSLCVRDTAKHLGLGQKALYEWLRLNKWTYRRVGMAHDLAYQDKIVSGVMEHKVSTVHHADGEDRIRTQARVTAKGLARLAKLLQPTAMLVARAA